MIHDGPFSIFLVVLLCKVTLCKVALLCKVTLFCKVTKLWPQKRTGRLRYVVLYIIILSLHYAHENILHKVVGDPQ